MNHSPFFQQYRFCKRTAERWKFIGIFHECRVIKIPQHEIDEPERRHRSGHRNPAILVLPEGQVGFWMLQFHNVASDIVVEAYRKRHIAFRSNVGINFIIEIDIWIVLKLKFRDSK